MNTNYFSASPSSSKKVILFAALAVIALVGTFMVVNNQPATSNLQQVYPTWVYDTYFHWKQNFGKRYTTEEDKHRLGVFYQNSLNIQAHNARNQSWTQAVNEFADLSAAEFQELYLNLEVPATSGKVVRLVKGSETHVDWREKGAVTPIKDQKSCGSCWAFSAVGALEGLYFQQKGVLADFSEQQLVDCSRPQGNQGCNGGWMEWAFDYAAKYPMESQADYPYVGRDQTCKFVASKGVYQINGPVMVAQNDNDQMHAAVVQQPVSVAVDATSFQFYSKGIIKESGCSTRLNHGILAVGFTTVGADTYWMVKNSWGTKWGETGYVRMEKKGGKGAGTCGISMHSSYPK